MRSRLSVSTVSYVVVPCALFLIFFPLSILHPTNIAWLIHDDWGQHYLGWEAFRHTALHYPFNREYLLNYPTGTSVLFTDSNPLIALPLRLVSAWLPAPFQYIGPWFLVCLVLQFVFAHRLVRPHAPGPWSAIAGATLLSLLPTLYNRINHDTLLAHWLILWALGIFFSTDSDTRRSVRFAVVLVIAALVHPYLVFMVCAIWIADQAGVWLPLLRARRWSELARPAMTAGTTLVATGLAVAVSGGFDGSNSSGGGFGSAGMALDALINPVRKGFLLAFLRGGQYDGRAFEGFQYLGMGLLLLIAFAVRWHRKAPQAEMHRVLRRARLLRWPFLVLVLLAISSTVTIYQHTLLRIPLPWQLAEPLGVFRCSGRLFWPVTYTGVFLALVEVYQRELAVRRAALTVALIVQLVDMSPFALATRRAVTVAPGTPVYTRTPNPAWAAMVGAASEVMLVPSNSATTQKNLGVLYELAHRAIVQDIPVNVMYAARDNPHQVALDRREDVKFHRGILDPKRLYVMVDGCNPPAPVAARARMVDHVSVIAPLGEEPPSDERPAAIYMQLGQAYRAADGLPLTCFYDEHWARPESGWSWSEGDRSEIDLPLPPGFVPRDLTLKVSVSTYEVGKPLQLLADGKPIAEARLERGAKEITGVVPASATRDGRVVIGFVTESMTPEVQRHEHEARRLGVRLWRLQLD